MSLFARDDEYKVVILVRQDVKMSKGKTAAQASHAAVACALAAKKNHPREFSGWETSGGQKIVALKVTSLKELFEFKAIADQQGITNAVVCDAGRTEIDPGTITCLGIGPEKQSVIDKITGDLSML